MNKLGLLWVSGLLLIMCFGTANAGQINDAAGKGDIKALAAIVKANPSSANSKDQYGWTPLFDACEHGRTAAVKFLIAHGANVNVGDDDIGTPLQRAANADIARTLLAAGASVRSTGPTLGTPLYQAIVDDRRDVVRLLRPRTPNLNIHEAAGLGDVHRVAQLLKSDPKLCKATDGSDRTPLHVAANAAVAKMLIAKGASVNAISGYDSYPILDAAGYGHIDVIRVLLHHGANIEAGGQLGGTPLWEAAYANELDTVKFLLDRKADANASAGEGMSVLQSVAMMGYARIAALLIKHGAKVNSADDFGTTPLIDAAAHGYLGMVKLLISNHTAVNARTTSESFVVAKPGNKSISLPAKSTALRAAETCGHSRVANLLGAHGGKV